jgi:hypothetical protein
MGLTVKSDNSTDELRIDPTSKAAHVTLYDTAGNEINPSFTKAGIVIDANNTSIVALAAGATFTGVATDILNYNQVNIEIYATPSTAKASFYFQFSKDGSNWDVSVPSLVRDPTFVIPIPVINVHKYFRVVYVNDGGVGAIAALGLTDTAGTPTLQTNFRLTTYLLPLATKELTRTMDQTIQGSDAASLVRAGIMAKNPTNNYVNSNQSGLSLSNNSTAVLGAGASFTGVYEEVLGYSSIALNIDSDLVGTLEFQGSQDGTNQSFSLTRTFTKVSSGQNYVFIPTTKYVRIKYTNTAGTQSYFRLQTVFKSTPFGAIFTPTNTPLDQNSLAQVVIAVPTDGTKTTYSAATNGLAPALTPTDVFTITGSATKTIRVTKITFSAVKTAASTIDVLLLKRSTANNGGVSAAVTATSFDSSNAAATATVLAYTTNPTTGTLVGNVRNRKCLVPTSGNTGDYISYEFGQLGQAVVLRGINQVLSINLNGVTMTGGLCNFAVEWTEE